MTITRVFRLSGDVIKTKAQLVEETGWTKRSIETRLAEIEEEQHPGGRYEKCTYCVNRDGGFVTVNYLVWMDYIHFRKRLQEKNLRKSVPPYDPYKVAFEYGFYQDKEMMKL